MNCTNSSTALANNAYTMVEEAMNNHSVIICSGRRTSQTEFINYLPSMTVTTLHDEEAWATSSDEEDKLNDAAIFSKKVQDTFDWEMDATTISLDKQDTAIVSNEVQDALACKMEAVTFKSPVSVTTVTVKMDAISPTLPVFDGSSNYPPSRRMRTSQSLSPVRHVRTRALSDTDFEACIIPNL